MKWNNKTTIYIGPFVRSKMFCAMFHFLNKFNWSMWGYPKIQSQSLLLNQSTCVQTNLHRRITPQPTMAVGCNDICADSTRYNSQTSFPLLLLFPACHWFPVLLPTSNGMKTNPVYFTFPKFKFFIINTHDLVFFVHQWNLLLKSIRSISGSFLPSLSYFILPSWFLFKYHFLFWWYPSFLKCIHDFSSFCFQFLFVSSALKMTYFFHNVLFLSLFFAHLFSFFVVHTFFQFSYISFFILFLFHILSFIFLLFINFLS